LIRYFRSLKNSGIPFPVDGSTAKKSDVTIQFLVGGLVIHFTGIFHLSGSVQKLFQEFHACAMVEIFFNFREQI
jgi:hypothetical protein